MATTPLIRTPQADGGTFYTFSSSAKDLSRTLNNDELKLVFSKFVLLNLPDFDRLPLDFGSLEMQTAGEQRNFKATGLPSPGYIKATILRSTDIISSQGHHSHDGV